MLGQAAIMVSEAAQPAFSTVKLPCCGVVLLTWRAAQEADPDLPLPSAVVQRLIAEIESQSIPRLK